ncbi:MAG: hypothetical protein ABR985_12975 [Methanotrichaceae archaeon]|jgi:hypothetical protein
MTAYDRAEILRGIKTYHKPGDVFEIRVPKAGRFKTISGYFDNFNAAADAVVGLDDEQFAGVYFTINPVNPALLSRSANRTKRYAETTTSDEGIVRLNWLPIDLDAKRPVGISSTDIEHLAAIKLGKRIKTSLVKSKVGQQERSSSLIRVTVAICVPR